MAVNKTTTVDNKKITEGPATREDDNKFSVHCMQVRELVNIQTKNEKPNKNNSKLVAGNKAIRILSTDLEKGMTIVAKAGGNPNKNKPREIEH